MQETARNLNSAHWDHEIEKRTVHHILGHCKRGRPGAAGGNQKQKEIRNRNVSDEDRTLDVFHETRGVPLNHMYPFSGPDGKDGPPGTDGEQGKRGEDARDILAKQEHKCVICPQGAMGPVGAPGPQGPSGNKGEKGVRNRHIFTE